MKHKIISFIGMDGSGKTTLTNKLIKDLSKKGYKTKYIYSGKGRKNILPIQFFGQRYVKNQEKKTKNKRTTPKEIKISLIRTLSAPIFAFDLFLRYLFVILPKIFKYDFVITDRYSTDILLMAKVPFGLKKFLYFFLPRPNKIFYIYHDLKVLNRRKPSHPYEDLKRQEKLFRKILRKIKHIPIKNEKIEESLNQIEKEILNDH